ncbi:histidine phosphatase family protein, partial [bacterium]|nr:histidine phosphatase family protein [bacterium]
MKCTICGRTALENPSGLLSLMRHGRTGMNESHLMVGSIDDPLSPTGRQDAEEKARCLQEKRTYSRIVSSPMKRAKETAEIFGKVFDIPVEFDSRLRERCVGEQEGKPEFPGMLAMFLGEELPSPAEPLNAFRERVIDALFEITFLDEPDKKILVVTHALVL